MDARWSLFTRTLHARRSIEYGGRDLNPDLLVNLSIVHVASIPSWYFQEIVFLSVLHGPDHRLVGTVVDPVTLSRLEYIPSHIVGICDVVLLRSVEMTYPGNLRR